MPSPRRTRVKTVASVLSALVVATLAYGVTLFAQQSTYPAILEGQLWKELLPWGLNLGANDEVIWAQRQDLNNIPSSAKVDTGERDPLFGDIIYASAMPPSGLGWPPADNPTWNTPYGYDEASSVLAANAQFAMLGGIGECTFSHVNDYDIGWWIYWPQVRYCKGPLVAPGTYAKLPPAPGRLLNPVGIAISGKKVYVSDLFNHRIQVFDFYGNLIPTKFPIGNGVPGSGRYNYDTTYPTLHYRPYAAIPGYETFDGGYSGQQVSAPYGIALDSAASPRLLVADSGNNRVAIFNEDGTVAFGTEAAPVHAVIPTPIGTNNLPLGPDPFKPDQIAMSPNTVLSQPGTVIAPNDPQVNGRVVVTDRVHCYVAILDTGFNLIKSFPADVPPVAQHDSCKEPDLNTPAGPGEFSTVTGVRVDAQSRVYIADHAQNVVQVFDKNGNFLTMIGKPGQTNPGGAGTLNGPVGLLIDQFGRLGVIDSGNARAVFYDLSAGPASAAFAFQVPTTVAFDDFPIALAMQVGPKADGLDPKGRILATDPLRRRVLRFELPELVIVNATADVTNPNVFPKLGVGSFDVVVPFQKASPVNGVVVTVTPQDQASVQIVPGTIVPALSVHPNIPAGQLMHYTFQFTSTIPEAKFDITAKGDCDVNGNCLAKAPDAAAVARALCQSCSAGYQVFDYPAAQPTPVPSQLIDTTDKTIFSRLVTGWYDRRVFVRLSPNTPPGTAPNDPSRVIAIEWSYGGEAGFQVGTFTTVSPVPNDGDYVDVPVTIGGLSWINYRAITNEGSASSSAEVLLPVDLEPPTMRFTSWSPVRSGTDGILDWHNQPVVSGVYEVKDDYSGAVTPSGTATFTNEGRYQFRNFTLVDEVGHSIARNSLDVTLGRYVNIDRGAPQFIETQPIEFTVPQSGSDATGRYAQLPAGALLLHAVDPKLSTGEPGSRPGPFDVPSPAGKFYDGQTMTFTATDFAGNSSTTTAVIRVERTAPQVVYLSVPTVVYGSDLTMKAQVTPSFATGTVQFTFDGRTATGTLVDETVTTPTGTVTRRVATVTLPKVFSPIANNPYVVNLAYSGDANLAPITGLGQVRVLPYPIVVTADNKSKLYGEVDPPLTFTSVPDPAHLLLPTDAFVGNIARVVGPAVGIYEIQKFQLALNNPNYDLIFNNGTFTIIGLVPVNPRPKTITYGDPDPVFDFDYGPFPDGSSIANLTATPTCAAPGPRTAGIHNIIQCGGATGYLLQFAYPKANLTILKATPTMTLTGGTFTYDAANHPGVCTVTGVRGESLTGTVTYDTGTVPVNAGTVTATCTFAGDTNYQALSKTATITILKRPITITGGTFSILVGAPDPSLACSLSSTTTTSAACRITAGSLLTGDTAVGVLQRDPGTTVGTYPIRQGTLAVANPNYALTYINGSLAITNGTPVAVDDSASTLSPNPVTISVLGNDSDPNNDPLTVTGFTQPVTGGTVAQAGNTLVFTPAPGFGGIATFTYTISDGKGGTATATVRVTVNRPPVAVNDSGTTENTTPIDVAVLGNDSDPDADPLTITTVTQPLTGGTVAIVNGKVRFTPTAGFVGTVTFTYTISDGRGGFATATVTITVTAPTNRPPVAVNDSATTADNKPVDITVLSNDSDPDKDPLTVTTFTQPTTGGTVTKVGNVLTFTPTLGFVGTATFTYTISDGKGGTATATVTVTVTYGSCVCTGFTTFTQGGWGAKPTGTNPGSLLAARFAQVYPMGVSIGGARKLTFTSAAAIEVFLPASGTASVLSSSAVNPKSSSAGVLAGQTLALQLSVDFSKAGITKKNLGYLVYQGRSVNDILSIANAVLGGNLGALPTGWSVATLNSVLDSLNRNFDNGTSNLGFLTCPK